MGSPPPLLSPALLAMLAMLLPWVRRPSEGFCFFGVEVSKFLRGRFSGGSFVDISSFTERGTVP